MKNYSIKILVTFIFVSTLFTSCSSSNDSAETGMEEVEESEEAAEITGELHAAYAEFDSDETDIYLSSGGTKVTIETTGNPNHKSVYWSESSDLYIEESDVAVTPTKIDERDGSDVLIVSASPQLASSSTSTELNTIGISVSGAAIFNDEEGNGALDQAAASLDWTVAHIGPGVYHYHLEPVAFSDDDENLIGVLKDGFFIYGRKCNATGTYPTDLDSSGGHTSTTQHTDEAEYHYHVINELYSTTGSYIVFAGPYKGEI